MKTKHPYWNWFAIATIVSAYFAFYNAQSIAIKLNWDGDFLLFSVCLFSFIWIFFKAGIENERLTNEYNSIGEMKKNPEHLLFEWLNECLSEYVSKHKPRKQIIISAIQMRLLQFDENVEYDGYKYKTTIYIGEISEINSYIDDCIKNFKEMEGSPSISEEAEQNCMAFILTNACLNKIK